MYKLTATAGVKIMTPRTSLTLLLTIILSLFIVSCDKANVPADLDKDGVADNQDVDDDGDGLIEIATADELNQVRYDLLGTGIAVSSSAASNTAGCGGQAGIKECNGYELTADISLQGYDNWQPIGDCFMYKEVSSILFGCQETKALFNSIFNGNNYIISDLTIINPPDSHINASGLFGAIGSAAQLHNVHVRAASISGGLNNVGILVGYADNAVITGSSAQGKINSVNKNTGALLGYGNQVEITSSYVVGETVVSATGSNVGAMLGIGNQVTIISSYVTGATVSGVECIGGMVGYGINSRIAASYVADVTVSGMTSIGALIGTWDSSTTTASYVSGVTVSGMNNIGTLGGGGTGSTTASSYTTGADVRGTSNVGALIGDINNKVTSSYWNSETTSANLKTNPQINTKNNIAPNILGEPQTTNMLQSQTDFNGIYSGWANYWCDPASGEFTANSDSQLAQQLGGGDITSLNTYRAWDLGTANQYPALTCTPVGLTTQAKLR